MREPKSHAAAEAEREAAVVSNTGSHIRSRDPRADDPARAQDPTRMVTYESTLEGQIMQDETRATRRKALGREMGWDDDDASTYVYATLEPSEETPSGAHRRQPTLPRSAMNAPLVQNWTPSAPPPKSVRSLEQPTPRMLPIAAPSAPSLPAVSVPAASMPAAATRVDWRSIAQSTAAVNWLPAHGPLANAARVRRLALAAAAFGAVVLAVLGVHTFTRDQPTSTVQLMTDPVDADVTLDGVLAHGSASPFVLSEVTLNVAHAIVVSKAGYRSWSTLLTLRSERPVLLPHVQLTPESRAAEPLVVPTRYAAPPPPPGRTPPAASAAPAIPGRVAASPHLPLRAGAAAGLRSSAQPRSRVQSAAERARASPPPARSSATPLSTRLATLRINSRPWSQVYVDGRLIGATPQMQIVLSAGVHTVTLVNPDFALKRVIALSLAPGQIVTKLVDLTN